jgi:cytochrome c biogenesis protein CcdA
MQEWLNGLFTTPEWSITLFLGALLLGGVSAVGSTCNIAALGAIAGYSGVKESRSKKELLFTCLGFVIGTILALAIIGTAIGYVGQTASNHLMSAGKFFAGIVLVFFGLVTLDLFPVKLPSIKLPTPMKKVGLGGDILFGFALGGSSLACTLTCCSPILPFVIGMSAIEGNALKSTLLMGMFGLGFSLPLAAILMGFSFGKLAIGAGKSMKIIKRIAGILLLGIGFYFLITI